jgi:hypothetical protein
MSSKRFALSIYFVRSFGSHAERDIRNEFLPTRIDLVLFSAALIIIIEYYALFINTYIITLRSPSLNTITKLNETTLVCPCSISIIPYEIYIPIKPRYSMQYVLVILLVTHGSIHLMLHTMTKLDNFNYIFVFSHYSVNLLHIKHWMLYFVSSTQVAF